MVGLTVSMRLSRLREWDSWAAPQLNVVSDNEEFVYEKM